MTNKKNNDRKCLSKCFLELSLAMLFIGGFLTLPLITTANTALENQELARINRELSALYPMINAAEKQQMSNERVTFRYDWLRKDIPE